MSDGPVFARYPHDRLTRLASAMTDTLAATPGTGDVRGVVMLDDGDGGCVHPHGYPGYPAPADKKATGPLFIDVTAHLVELGRALGVQVDILINGEKVPGL
jgi:hypothetical protein